MLSKVARSSRTFAFSCSSVRICCASFCCALRSIEKRFSAALAMARRRSSSACAAARLRLVTASSLCTSLWSKPAKREVGLVFIPHLLPIIRGIHATLYARITREVDFQALYEKRYAGEAFVDVMPAGSHPDTRSVRAANMCRIALHRPPQGSGKGDTLVVLCVIDNLVKGAAGQAVQNMNLMCGFAEATGLSQPPVVP